MPKALVPVAGRTLLDLSISRLEQFGYRHFVINVHHFAQQIIDHVAAVYPQVGSRNASHDSGAPTILFSDETEQLLETGGALKKAAPLFVDDSPILIHNVDILDNVDYASFASEHHPDEDAVLLVSRRRTKRYLLFDGGMRLMGWTNVETGEVKSPYPWLRQSQLDFNADTLQVGIRHSSPTTARTIHASAVTDTLYAFAFSGIHSFSPRLFLLMDRFPDRFGIIDFYLSVCHRSRIVGMSQPDLRILDVGKLDSLEQAESFLQQSETTVFKHQTSK
jgi:NDP-sugar pyrophosphorylase family protein